MRLRADELPPGRQAGGRRETLAVAGERKVETFPFRADEPAAVVAAMGRLSAVGDGWVNLRPTVDGEDDDRPSALRFFTLLSGGGPGLTMGTWVPAAPGQRGRERARLGLTHRAGRRAVAALAAGGAAVPAGWLVEQDHPTRGLVVRPLPDAPAGTVVAFALGALSALSVPGAIRGWRAEVHLPRSA